MNLFLRIFGKHIPVFLKKKGLQELSRITADAFHCRVPVMNGRSYKECLMQFAVFTKEEVEKANDQGADMQTIRNRLFENASGMGKKLRNKLSVTTADEAMLIARLLYRAIGIEFQCTSRSEITMHRCFFSRVYSPAVCRIISSLDEGIISGLLGGAQLHFSQRITEGGQTCRAIINTTVSSV